MNEMIFACLYLQVCADLLPYRWSCQDPGLLSGLTLLGGGLRQRFHPAARCRGEQTSQVSQGSALPDKVGNTITFYHCIVGLNK